MSAVRGHGAQFPLLRHDLHQRLVELLSEFEAETGIKVNMELLEEQASVQKTQLELASGTGNYDIVGVVSGNMPLYGQNGG